MCKMCKDLCKFYVSQASLYTDDYRGKIYEGIAGAEIPRMRMLRDTLTHGIIMEEIQNGAEVLTMQPSRPRRKRAKKSAKYSSPHL